MKQKNWLKILSCSVFAGLYIIVAVISLICSTEFFKLAHSGIMSWVLAIGFEIGAMSCLLSTLILPKNKLGLVWFMFIILTLFQCMGNMFAAFIHLENFKDWIDMFGLSDLELIAQKRVLAGISGIILPLVALGFIRIMADVLQDSHKIAINDTDDNKTDESLFLSQEEIDVPRMHENMPENTIIEEPVDVKSEPAKEIKKPEPVKEIKKEEIKKPEPVKEVKKEEPVKEIKKSEPVKEIKKPEPVKEIKKEEPVNTNKNIGKVWNPSLNAEIG